MGNRKVSVIIPMYCAEKYIADLLEDLLEQTYDNLEIIVVNDGSPDNSQEIVDKYAEKDKRIKRIVGQNEGVSVARNIGLQFATGEYVRFLDADDRIPKDSIKQLVEPMIQNNEVDIVFGGFKTIPDRQLYNGEQCEDSVISPKDLLGDFLKHMRTFYYGVVWNKLYKKEIIDFYNIQFERGITWCEDYLFNVEYYKHINTGFVLTLNKYIYDYIQRAEGITGSLKQNGESDFIFIETLRYERTKELFEQYGLEERYERELRYLDYKHKITNLTRKTKNMNIKQRYLEFKSLLQDKMVIESFMLREKESSNDFFLDCVCKTMRNRGFFVLFLVMNVKNNITQNKQLNTIWNKIFENKIQKLF